MTAGGAALRLRRVSGGAFDPEYSHFDAQGSVVAATYPAGTVRFREQYNPFGEERLDPAANDNDTGYTGHLMDDASGLIYMQARYYDPVIGRFVSTDPIGYQDQFNLYAYVHNDPINNIDSSGEAAQFALAGLCVGPQAVGCLVVGAALAGACYLWCDDLGALILESRRRTPIDHCIEPRCDAPTGGVTETGRCPDCEVKKRREEGENEKWWEDDDRAAKAKERKGGSPNDGNGDAQNASLDAEIDVAAAVGPLFSNESIVGVSVNADGNLVAEVSQTGSRIIKEVELND